MSEKQMFWGGAATMALIWFGWNWIGEQSAVSAYPGILTPAPTRPPVSAPLPPGAVTPIPGHAEATPRPPKPGEEATTAFPVETTGKSKDFDLRPGQSVWTRFIGDPDRNLIVTWNVKDLPPEEIQKFGAEFYTADQFNAINTHVPEQPKGKMSPNGNPANFMVPNLVDTTFKYPRASVVAKWTNNSTKVAKSAVSSKLGQSRR